MISNRFYIVLVFLMSLHSSCSNKITIDQYSEILQINFPKDMDLVYYDTHSDFQDYSIHSIYKVSSGQNIDLLDEIIKNLCPSQEEKNKQYFCWQRCGDFFSFEYTNEKEAIDIFINFIAKNDAGLLDIREVKF